MAVNVRVPILFHKPLTTGGNGVAPGFEDPVPEPIPDPCKGAQGPQGPQGFQGRQGFVGPQGVPGMLGPQGLGAVGPQGLQGPAGAAGAAGVQGPSGPQGMTGPAGVTGAQGFQGFQGTGGTQGAVGAQGRQGTVGSAGTQGAQGPSGSGVFAEIATPVEVNSDIRMPQSISMQNTFISTDSPNQGVMTVNITAAGNYVFFWYAELSRGSAGGGNRMLARVLHTNQASVQAVLANWRKIQGLENSSATIPTDDSTSEIARDGDIVTWSGFDRVTLATGSHTFALQYAADAIGSSSAQDVLHTRRQKLLLVRVS
jgi:hypothetical protein